MKIIETEKVSPRNLTRDEMYFVYNGMDSCLTLEVYDKIKNQPSKEVQKIYEFELAQMKPALAMMLRGISVDLKAAAEMTAELQRKEKLLEEWLERMARAVWNNTLNPNSPQQLIKFFYTAMGLPKQYINQKGEKKVSTNRESLEKLAEKYKYARPIVNTILDLRDTRKKLAVISACIDDTGRFRASYNIGGTETGRWSSSKNVFGGGTNAQNITSELREIFIADPGYYIGYIDLEQAESRGVGYLSGDEAYIKACESGDLHTKVSRDIWTDLPWTGNLAEDKVIAKQPFYRHYSYRDMAKKGGHASNYYGQPYTVAKNLKVPVKLIEEFQFKYFLQFSGVKEWHKEVQRELQTKGYLITPFGRKRVFYGRLRDDATLREAIAFVPQSLIADILNLALYLVWKQLDDCNDFQILGQVHDAIIFQVKENRLDLVDQLQEVMKIQVPIKGKTMTIPSEVTLGYTWKTQYDYPKNFSEIGERPKFVTSMLELPANLTF